MNVVDRALSPKNSQFPQGEFQVKGFPFCHLVAAIAPPSLFHRFGSFWVAFTGISTHLKCLKYPQGYLFPLDGSLSYVLTRTDTERFLNLVRVSLSQCHHPYPGSRMQLPECFFSTHTGPRLLFRGSASSIYPLFLYGYSMISGPQRFGYATARRVAFPSLARAFTFRLLVLGTPSRKVEYNHLTNLSRQLPDLDFHRQGTQHYGLRAEHTWTIGYSAGSSVEIFFQKVYIPIGNRGLHSFLI